MTSSNEEAPVPDTAAEDGRRKLGAYGGNNRLPGQGIQPDFLRNLKRCLSDDRLSSYAGNGATEEVTIARYLLNISLCESLYTPLQLCEVALRNRLHQHLTHFNGTEEWYNNGAFPMTEWANQEIKKAIERIQKNLKPVSAGRVIAELQFGFWTSLLEHHYEHLQVWPSGFKFAFPYLVKSKHNRKEIKRTLEEIRILRNRVFHHERIVHWTNLDAQYTSIIDVIGWTSRETQNLAKALDRFTATRTNGLKPWLEMLRVNWPAS